MSTSPSSTAPGAGATVALVPLRAPGDGKSRLAGRLAPHDRAALVAAMLGDVVAALVAAGTGTIVVAADGPRAAAVADELGVEVVRDPPVPPGTATAARLDLALAAAAARIGPTPALLIVAADLPRLTADDVGRVLAADAEVVVAPTLDGGTGALLRRPGDACATAYGVGSAARHLDLARRGGRTAAEVVSPGFAADVDVADDLDALAGATDVGPRTADLVARLRGVTGVTAP